MLIKSNGLFNNGNIEIDISEDWNFSDLEYNIANLVVWDWNDTIDKLDIFKNKKIATYEDSIVVNYYVEFDRDKNYWFVASFYCDDDIDNETKALLEKIQYEVKIEINTDKEKQYFDDLVFKALQVLGVNKFEEVWEE